MPEPPYSSGMRMPSNPMLASFGTSSVGNRSSRSHRCAFGAISARANSRTLWRRSLWCSSKSKSMKVCTRTSRKPCQGQHGFARAPSLTFASCFAADLDAALAPLAPEVRRAPIARAARLGAVLLEPAGPAGYGDADARRAVATRGAVGPEVGGALLVLQGVRAGGRALAFGQGALDERQERVGSGVDGARRGVPAPREDAENLGGGRVDGRAAIAAAGLVELELRGRRAQHEQVVAQDLRRSPPAEGTPADRAKVVTLRGASGPDDERLHVVDRRVEKEQGDVCPAHRRGFGSDDASAAGALCGRDRVFADEDA